MIPDLQYFRIKPTPRLSVALYITLQDIQLFGVRYYGLRPLPALVLSLGWILSATRLRAFRVTQSRSCALHRFSVLC